MQQTTLALIACVKSKLNRPALARELYVSDLFGKMRTFVEAQGWDYCILSAEHGLLAPTQLVEPYEKTLNRMPEAARRAWAAGVLAQLLLLPPPPRIVFLAGIHYRKHLIGPLQARGHQVEVPLVGLSIGEQLRWLKAATSPATSPSRPGQA